MCKSIIFMALKMKTIILVKNNMDAIEKFLLTNSQVFFIKEDVLIHMELLDNSIKYSFYDFKQQCRRNKFPKMVAISIAEISDFSNLIFYGGWIQKKSLSNSVSLVLKELDDYKNLFQ